MHIALSVGAHSRVPYSQGARLDQERVGGTPWDLADHQEHIGKRSGARKQTVIPAV
jgi:hypothetical protein